MSEKVLAAAEVYRHADPANPTKAVADSLGVSRSAAAKLVGRARAAGLLPSTTRGVRLQHLGPHQPRGVRWADSSGAWMACAQCRTPWPCAMAPR